MIIYAAQPNRFYPYFFGKFYNDIRDRYRPCGKSLHFLYKKEIDEWYNIPLIEPLVDVNLSECTFHQSFADAFNNKERLLHKDGKNYIYFDEKHRSEHNMTIGVLNAERIYKEKDDFIISTIIHPVDRVYEMYYFMTTISCGKALPQMSKEDLKFYGNKLGITTKNRDVSLRTVYQLITMEEYIDAYIENKGVFELYDKIATDENNYRQVNVMGGNDDFIGFITDPVSILRTANFLNEKVNLGVRVDELLVFSKKIKEFCEVNTYRRKDLERLLESDIEHYYGLKKQFMGF
jgi:hypothetical protein